jgi:Peptidase family M28/PA domain
MPKDPAQVLADAVSASKLMTYTREVSRWVRLSGSDEEAHAFDYLETTLKSFGLTVQRYQHDALISWPGTASLEIIGGPAEAVECITHSFAASAPPGGLEAEVIDRGAGGAGSSARGKIVLVDGLASPGAARAAEDAGAVGAIFINPPELHEMIISTVWGSPTPEDLGALPKLVAVSVKKADGEALRERSRGGDLRVRLRAAVDTRWRKTPLLIADLTAADEPERFVLFSGHVDSWHYGAMDNGSANAVMVEMARLFSRRQKRLRRGIRFAFWSGHSHGRYSGSTWYADSHWDDLRRHAVLHLNVDSPGGKGATVLSEALTMAETWGLAAECIKTVSGQTLEPRRMTRMGDQSFWGIGLPSMFVGVSHQPPAPSAAADAFALLGGGPARHGGLGWWWHSTEDTLDKIDKDYLRRDAQVYALVLWRWCTAPVLPLDYRKTAQEIRGTLRAMQETAGDAFDMSPPLNAIERFAAAAERLAAAAEPLAGLAGRGTRKQREAAAALNDAMMRIGRALIPINYTAAGAFGHDAALPVPPIPPLHPAARLRDLRPDTDEHLTLLTQLVRNRNRVTDAIDTATDAAEQAMTRI